MLTQAEARTSGIDEPLISLLAECKKEEDSENYDKATSLLSSYWGGPGTRPRLDDLRNPARAELLLRAGSITGRVGETRQDRAHQETAIHLLSECVPIFETLNDTDKIVEANVEIADCLRRAGRFKEAREQLNLTLATPAKHGAEQRARAHLSRAQLEESCGRLHDALQILTETARLFEAASNETLKGKFHLSMGNVLGALCLSDRREEFADRTLVEYSAASYHFEKAGNNRLRVAVQNNLANFSLKTGKLKEAHEHLDRARAILSTELDDSSGLPALNEIRARVLLAENRTREAEDILRMIMGAGSDAASRLGPESLITWGTARARRGHYEQSRHALERATDVAEKEGNPEVAGRAQLAILEELSDHLHANDISFIYQRADRFLSESQNKQALERLRACARSIIGAVTEVAVQPRSTKYVYASKESAALLRIAARLARTEGPVMITGEPGSGKETLARLIHEFSTTAGHFKIVNCATTSGQPFETVFSPLTRGTIFLDEISNLSHADQLTLLRCIEPPAIQVAGSPGFPAPGPRLVASSSLDMSEQIRAGNFRADLYSRLHAFSVVVPPLRSRADDIPALAESFIEESNHRHGKSVRFTTQALDALRSLPLRNGNVRELRTLIERTIASCAPEACITADAVETLRLRQTLAESLYEPWANCSLVEEVNKYEGDLIALALKEAGGKITGAARLLGLKHQTLSQIIKTRQPHLSYARKPKKERARPKRRTEKSNPAAAEA